MQSTTALASRIVQARTAAGLMTPDAAAIRLGMLSAVYRRHKTGEAAPKPAELRRYAEVFGMSVGWLGTGIEVGPRKVG